VRGEDILLNGKPIFLRGVSMHEEELGANPVRAITPAAAHALMSEIRDGLHGNFVRLAHYPHSEVMTRMADKMGLLVWSEVPVYWRVNWSNPQTLAWARQQIREEIQRDRNRASIILWSVANETPVGDARNAFLRTLIGDVRALDDSRLVTAALLSGRQGNVQTIDDPLVNDLDVMAINTYNGWYTPDALADVAKLSWRSPVHKPLIFSEFGADALAGYHDASPSPHKYSEEYQAEYYRQTLAMTRNVPFLRGMAPWILKDFRSPRRQHPVYQQGWNRKGLISPTGEHKLAFAVLADEYARRRDAK
jgi:beta-glucuronidase